MQLSNRWNGDDQKIEVSKNMECALSDIVRHDQTTWADTRSAGETGEQGRASPCMGDWRAPNGVYNGASEVDRQGDGYTDVAESAEVGDGAEGGEYQAEEGEFDDPES